MKYFATHFGIKITGNVARLDLGDEQTVLPDGRKANVSECQIIMNPDALKGLHDLIEHQIKEIKKKKK